MSHTVLEDTVSDDADLAQGLSSDLETAMNAGKKQPAESDPLARVFAYFSRLRRGSLAHAWWTLGRSPFWAAVCVGMIAVTISIALALVRWPQPSVHDEFSYLLAADTFAQGRLANPAHPLGKFFETFHVIQQPSYASKYQPGQGLMLALGQVLCGTPLAGVWISMAMAAMALVWMLRAWVIGRWALLGGLIFALHTNIQFAWGHSYWGGALTFTGGAILFGACARLLKSPSMQSSLLMACGALILGSTRPYEGFIACLAVGAMLLWNQIRKRTYSWKQFAAKVVLPATMVLTAGAICLGLYNQAVTGHPLRMAYAVHEAEYGISPLFVWQSIKASPEYAHETIRAFYEGWGLEAWQQHQTVSGFLMAKVDAVALLWGFFFGGVLTVPLIAAPQVLRDPRLRTAWIFLGLLLAASMLVFWTLPHYFAPAAPLLFLVLIQAVRHVRASFHKSWPLAKFAPGLLVGAQLLLLLSAFFSLAIDPTQTWAEDRAQIQDYLANQPGEHLVLVEYEPDHNVHQEWVYNGADLENAKVLWARSIDPEANQPLREHFSERTIWRLIASNQGQQLEKLPATASPDLQQNPFENEE